MLETEALDTLFRHHGFHDFKWISARDIVVAQWVRYRCMFGCPDYGKSGTCPPNVPSVDECRKMISEYNHAALFHFEREVEKPQDRKPWSRDTIKRLVELERQVFLAGHYKAILIPFDSCGFCEECTGSRAKCRNPKIARAGADALGIDVFATVRSVGYPIQVLKDYTETMDRYAFLLVD